MRHELETERFYLARQYGEAVAAAGGVPVHIPLIPDPALISAFAERLDGVLGREPQLKLGPVHPLKDETDLLFLK